MESLFEKLGLSDRVIWFDAIETPEDGRIGCRLSHLNIIKYAKKNKADNVLIFEDDIAPTLEFDLYCLSKGIDTLKSVDWDILYLGGRVISPASDINDFLFKSFFWSAGSLCINNTVFERCLELERYSGPVDWFYSSPVQDFDCFSVNPCMFVQHPKFVSDLTSTTTDRRDAFLKSYSNRHNASPPSEEWTKKELKMYHDKS